MKSQIFVLTFESIFIDIFCPNHLPIFKPILAGVLYQPLDKPRFIEYFNNSLKESNISNIQECYLMSDLNVILLGGNKMLLDKR